MKKVFKCLKQHWWVIFFASFSLLSLTSEVFNGRLTMFDFEVYYRTALRFFNGEAIYRIESDDYYVFKYAPTAAIYFMPFLVLPLWLSKIIYWLSISFLLGFVLQKMYTRIRLEQLNNKTILNNAIFFSLLTVLIHIHSELTLGQVNLLLLFMYIFSIFAIQESKTITAAFLIGASIFIKPFGLIFIPYLLLKAEFKLLLYMFLVVLVLTLLPILFYPSFDSFILLYKSWFYELAIELGNKQSLLAKSNHTIFSVLARYTPLGLVLSSRTSQVIYQVIVLIAIGWLVFDLERRKQSIILIMSVIILLIPLLAATSKNAFIFALPLTLYLLAYFKGQKLIYRILVIFGCFLVGGNNYELYGPKYSMLYTELSLYTIGSICLLIAVFLLKPIELESKAKPIEANKH